MKNNFFKEIKPGMLFAQSEGSIICEHLNECTCANVMPHCWICDNNKTTEEARLVWKLARRGVAEEAAARARQACEAVYEQKILELELKLDPEIQNKRAVELDSWRLEREEKERVGRA